MSGPAMGAISRCSELWRPRFKLADIGAKVVGEPENANVLLVVGVVSAKMKEHLKQVYEIKPPRIVVAAGSCAQEPQHLDIAPVAGSDIQSIDRNLLHALTRGRSSLQSSSFPCGRLLSPHDSSTRCIDPNSRELTADFLAFPRSISTTA